jgi:hypothetical protein
VVGSVSIYGMPSRSAAECAAIVLSHCKKHLANEGVVESVVICGVSLYPRYVATALPLLRQIKSGSTWAIPLL